MKNWKQERNYRPVRDRDGTIIGGVITVEGKEVQVSADVYHAYAKAERRDRYVTEQYEKGDLVSLEYLTENGVPLDQLYSEIAPDAEEEVLRRYNQEEVREILIPVLNALKKKDRALVKALYFDGVTERDYAKMLGIHASTVHYRRNQVLVELRRTIMYSVLLISLTKNLIILYNFPSFKFI